MNLGIIGMGRIGKVHLENILTLNDVIVLSVAEPNLTNEIKEYLDSKNIKNIYEDYNDVINDPLIDAILICSSTNTHAEISIKAANNKKHIFCEKPISSDVLKIKEVIEAVKKNNIKYQVGFNRRFDHNFSALKKGLKEIGDIHQIKITSRDPEAPPVEYVKVSGGIFNDMSIHDFDMLRFLGNSEIIEVFAFGSVMINDEIKQYDDVDTAIISVKYEDGSLGVIDNSRQAAYGYDQRAEVFGSHGQIKIANDTKSKTELSLKNGIIQEVPLYFFLERYQESFLTEIKSFIKAVKNNTKTEVEVIDGLIPVLIAKACKKSMIEKRVVSIKEIGEEYEIRL